MPDVIVRLIDLPCRVRGMTTPNDDGSYNVYINSRLDAAAQRTALMHELRHVRRGDFYRAAGIDEIESV